MSKEDKIFFQCDVTKFSLLDYAYTYMVGLKTYIAKEPLDNYDAAKKKYFLLTIAYYAVWTLNYSLLTCLIYLILHLTGSSYYLKIIFNNLFALFTQFNTTTK